MKRIAMVLGLCLLLGSFASARDWATEWLNMPLAQRVAFFEGYRCALINASTLAYSAEREGVAYRVIEKQRSTIDSRIDPMVSYPKFIFSLMDAYYQLSGNKEKYFDLALLWAVEH